ncbi:MAG: OmpA family protein [Deltaproteobacteria bacterium]|nr:OmpA family protein [Deltaproteobacteria bacterium]
MTEKLGIIVGIVSFLGFSVFCTWHHAMSPEMHPSSSSSPSSAPPTSLEAPFSSAALPSSTTTTVTTTEIQSPTTLDPIPQPSPAPTVLPPQPPTASLPPETLIQEEAQQPAVPHTLRGKVIEFDAGSDALSTKGRFALTSILAMLRNRPAAHIEITGHTDNLGTEDYNIDLSQRRAETVRLYLLSQGIAEEQLSMQAYGSSLPIANNATPEGRQRNRSAEVIVHSDSLGS